MNKKITLLILLILLFTSFTYVKAEAQTPTFRIMTESDSGDYIGQNKSWDFSNSNNSKITISQASDSLASFYVNNFSISNMSFGFASEAGKKLSLGLYTPAKRLPFRDSFNGIEISGDGRGCNTILGAFYVHEYVVTNGILEKAAIDFVQICEPKSTDINATVPKLYGSLRYGSSIPDSCNSQGCAEAKKNVGIKTVNTNPPSIPFITVLSPNGGEKWPVGSTQTIKWLSNEASTGKVNVYLYNENSAIPVLPTLIMLWTLNDGSENWTVPSYLALGDKYRIEIKKSDNDLIKDMSDASFSIVPVLTPTPSITVLSPNGGEVWQVGNNYQIEFKIAEGKKGYADLLVFPEGSEHNYIFNSFFSNIELGAGTFTSNWAIPQNVSTGKYIVKVYLKTLPVEGTVIGADTSDAPFSIVAAINQNQPPVISGVKAPTTLKVGEVGTWTVNAYDPEKGPLSYSVIWGDGTPGSGGGFPLSIQNDTTQAATFTHSYAKDGKYTTAFTITDNGGLSAKTSAGVSVEPVAGDLLNIKLDKVALNKNEIETNFKITNLDYNNSDPEVNNSGAAKPWEYIQQTIQSNNYAQDGQYYTTGLRSYGSVADAKKLFDYHNTNHTRKIINLSDAEKFGDDIFCHVVEPGDNGINNKNQLGQLMYYFICGFRYKNLYIYTQAMLNENNYGRTLNNLKEYYSNVINYDKNRIPYIPGLTLEETKDSQLVKMNDNAKDIVNDKYDSILSELKQLRDTIKEQQNEIKYLRSMANDLKDMSETMKNAINDFITYGVDSNTQKLGAGERAAVINSYKSAFDKLPETEAELTDAIKIANGRFPSLISDKAEKQAKEQFIKIYKRVPDLNDDNDNAAIKVMAYGLRQRAENRNLNSEKAGIKIFKAIYGRTPKTTEDWNIMQAITYSGAAR